MLGWTSYLQVAFAIGSYKLSLVLRNSCWFYMSKLGTTFTKKSLKIPATSSSSFVSFTFSLKAAATVMRYFARSKFSRSLLHKKNFSLIWQVVSS